MFSINEKIIVPSYRNDIETQNDLAEEITRMIGYDNIASKALALPVKAKIVSSKLINLFLFIQNSSKFVRREKTATDGRFSILFDVHLSTF